MALPLALQAQERLSEARQALKGEHKDSEKARKLLLEIVRDAKADSESLVWAEIYLGYIEDRAEHRQAAIEWYQKALAVPAVSKGSLDLAKFGLERPLVWIRHLDSAETQAATKPPEPSPKPAPHSAKKAAPESPPKRAYVTKQPPEGLMPVRNLSAQQRRENFEALWGIADAYYGQFQLKSIDWSEVGRRYEARLNTVTGDEDFYRMMFELVNELKDTHSWISNYSAPILGLATPDLVIDLFRDKPFVIAGPKAGWEVIAVDGMTPTQRIEWLRPYLHACSSERAFRRQAGRSLLAGKAGEEARVTLRAPDGHTETLSLKRSGRQTRPFTPAPAINLSDGRFVKFGRYPSGLGYIQFESFLAHDEVDQEFDRALEALRDTQGLILDIRDNPGGFGHEKIVARFLRKRTLIAIDYTRKNTRRRDLEKHKFYLEPSGKWQYTRPVALLVNDVTGSASDLIAAELRASGKIITLGTTTHGNVGDPVYGVLPCGLVVRISNGYVSNAEDRPIEVNGNVPDIVVEPDIRDYLEGRDPVLERAKEVLLATKKD